MSSLVVPAEAEESRFGMLADATALTHADAWVDDALKSMMPLFFQGFGAIHLMVRREPNRADAQVVILLHRYEIARGRHTSCWMLTGVSVRCVPSKTCLISRMMQYLSLYIFDETFPQGTLVNFAPLLRREALRRLAWAVFLLDSIADGGRYDIACVSESIIRNQLPCREDDFHKDNEVRTEPLYLDMPPTDIFSSAPQRTIGLSGHLVRIAAIRRRILHFAWGLKNSPKTTLSLHGDLLELTNRLVNVISSLPAELSFSRAQSYTLSPRMPAFILLHTLRHNCYIILERAKLLVYTRDGDPTMNEAIAQCRRDRISRALPTSGIIALALKHNANFDPHVGIQAYVALESERFGELALTTTVLLLETRRLEQTDPSASASAPHILNALQPLLSIMRLLSSTNHHVANLVS
jgi:hypothetical protein